MKKPRTMKIKTPIGNLMVEIGETEFSYYAAVALERNDGQVIDLTEGDIMKEDCRAEVCVWNDPPYDNYIQHNIPADALLAEGE